MTTDRTDGSLRPLPVRALAALLFALWIAAPAHAVEERRPLDSTLRSNARTGARHVSAAVIPDVGALERLTRRLRSIPLRPVSIGTTPRRPTDPEPGVGVVIRIPF